MPNKKELELERQAILIDMAGKINVMYDLLTRAVIDTDAPEEKKSERKTRKKTKKDE